MAKLPSKDERRKEGRAANRAVAKRGGAESGAASGSGKGLGGFLSQHYHSSMAHITTPKLRELPKIRDIFRRAPDPLSELQGLETDSDDDEPQAAAVSDMQYKATETLAEMAGLGGSAAADGWGTPGTPAKRSAKRSETIHVKHERAGEGSFVVEHRRTAPSGRDGKLSPASESERNAVAETDRRARSKQAQADATTSAAPTAFRPSTSSAFGRNPGLATSMAEMPWLPPNPTLVRTFALRRQAQLHIARAS